MDVLGRDGIHNSIREKKKMAKVQPNTSTPKAVVYDLAYPYCGEHTFTICNSILTYIPAEIKHLVFSNFQCSGCESTFAEAVMTDEKRNRWMVTHDCYAEPDIPED